MKLLPALRHQGKTFVGDSRDSHVTLAERRGIPLPPDEDRGFSADGGRTWLSRKMALGYMKKYDPKGYAKLQDVPAEGLHSSNLAETKGVEQKKVEDVLDLSTKTAIVFDRGGLYLYCAEKLAEKYKKVMYYLADADAYPTSQKATIGGGLPKVKRIHDFWKHLNEADIVYFFDVYDGELQNFLRAKGYTVFGSGRSERVEIDKILFLETLDKLKLPCPRTYVAKGMADLLDYLKKHDGKTLFLKNLHRGDFESRKFTSLAQSRPFLDDLRKRLGSASDTIEVLVQHKIESEAEVGYDGHCVDGEFTTNCIVGYEIKDRGFVGKVFAETPEIVKGVNDAFAPVFKKLGYRGNYSTEIRVTKDGKPYFIDPTCRVPSPPGEVLCELYENWAEATYQIAQGLVPELKPKAKYVAEVILTSEWHAAHEIHVKFPEKFRDRIKLKNHTIRDGEYYCIPNSNGAFFGAAVGWGDTLKEAIANVCEVAESIEADEYSFDCSVFDEATKAVEAGEKFGIRY